MSLSVASFWLVGSAVMLLLAAITHNQLEPSLGSAIGVTIAAAASLGLSLIAVVLAILGYDRDGRSRLTIAAVVVALLTLLSLAIAFPLIDQGALSRVT